MAVRSGGQLTRSLLIVDVHRRVDLGRRRLRSALLVWLIGYFRSRNSGPARPGCSPEMACWFALVDQSGPGQEIRKPRGRATVFSEIHHRLKPPNSWKYGDGGV